mmetsp:Transcript_10901/g.20516  ORF Transcript_10901/g.20516 Transcript_10901/m.20516 type:complete len:121 (-) Transcript_10901:909-1271(-)
MDAHQQHLGAQYYAHSMADADPAWWKVATSLQILRAVCSASRMAAQQRPARLMDARKLLKDRHSFAGRMVVAVAVHRKVATSRQEVTRITASRTEAGSPANSRDATTFHGATQAFASPMG